MGGSVSTFEGSSRLSLNSNAAAREAGLRFKGLKFKVCDGFAAALDGRKLLTFQTSLSFSFSFWFFSWGHEPRWCF
jgi:hypothetical protein